MEKAKLKPKLLFLDDEENIRLMLGMYLRQQGFDVTAVGTVPDALKLITQEQFEVLIADLNVGHPGDGFTVVSAMRRTQPRAITFILTGYPAFETALEAIRLQVDDYITKPTDTDALVRKIHDMLATPTTRHHHIQTRRLSEIISENLPDLSDEWLEAAKSDPELGAIKLSDPDRVDHVPRVLRVMLKVSRGQQISDDDRTAARDHGVTRRKQGFTVPLLIRESRTLQDVISRCVQSNLLAVQISYLISDLISIQRTKEVLLEESVAAFLKAKK
jgi:ActR/RegA family two-component response regulator